MNRRDFLKIAQFGLLGAMFPKKIDLDYSGGEMELSEILAKIANNEFLNPYEMDFLKSQGRDMQNRNSRMAQWTGADGNPQFINPCIESPVWKNALHSTIFDVSQSAATGSDAYLEVNQSQVRTSSKVFNLGGSSTRLKIATKNNFFMSGNISFESNSTGYRKIILYIRNKDGSGLPILEVVSQAINGEVTNISFSYLFDRVRLDQYNNFPIEEIDFSVLQNSGSTLSVTGQISLMEV